MAKVTLIDGSEYLIKDKIDDIAIDCAGRDYKFMRFEVLDLSDGTYIDTLFSVSQIKLIEE
jgi:hypothetical protein